MPVQSSALLRKSCHLEFAQRNTRWGYSLSSRQKCISLRGSYNYNGRKTCRRRFQIKAQLDVASAIDVINDLGFDTLTFLAVTVLVVPAFRMIKASPVSVLGSHICLNIYILVLYRIYIILFLMILHILKRNWWLPHQVTLSASFQEHLYAISTWICFHLYKTQF